MPMLLSTPEQWFRTEARDFYEFRPAEGQTKLPIELTTWIQENLSQRKFNTLGPSEHSGWICGGGGMQVLAMSEKEVGAFTARWEDANGKSLDPRWQCFQWRYQDWLEKISRIEVFKGRPPPGTQYRWLLCNGGLFWLRGRYEKTSERTGYPGEPRFDDWYAVNRSFPDLVITPEEVFCMGYDYLDHEGNLVINERGEFTAEYDHQRFGIPSPIEQSHRHGRALCKLLERLEIVGRTQKQPDFHHVVMFHPKATIERPSTKVFDTSNVIKADQFPTWHKQFVESLGIGTVLKIALNMRGLDTIKEWGEKLKRQHRPEDLLSLPDFMRPREPRTAVSMTAISPPTSVANGTPIKSVAAKAPVPVAANLPEEPAKRLICAHCATKISFPEGKFCWNNAKRFGGVAYCREHQALF